MLWKNDETPGHPAGVNLSWWSHNWRSARISQISKSFPFSYKDLAQINITWTFYSPQCLLWLWSPKREFNKKWLKHCNGLVAHALRPHEQSDAFLSFWPVIRHFHVFFFFCSDTVQNVRETADKLKMMNKKMIDLSKAGEATEDLEQYVSIIWSGLNYIIQV